MLSPSVWRRVLCGLIVYSACLTSLTTPSQSVASPLNYDLSTNLIHAHHYDGGELIDLNEMSAVKHLRDYPRSWVYNVNHDGSKGAVPLSVQAHFWLNLDVRNAKRDQRLDVLLAPAYAKQVVDVFINGKKLKNYNFDSVAWQTLSVELPASTLEAGYVHVKLHFRSRKVITGNINGPAVIQYVRLARKELTKMELKKVRHATLIRKDSLIKLPKKTGVDYYVRPVQTGTVKLDVRSGTLNVYAQVNKGQRQVLKRGVTGEVSLDLKRFKGAALRLMIRSPNEDSTFKGQITGEAPLQASQADSAELTKPKYVVFWLIDTLRADKLPFYEVQNSNGRKKVQTPNLSALAKESTVFEPFYVQGNESKASHASLFTGTYPFKHRVYNEQAKLPQPLMTLAELFKAEGYHTGGYVSNGYVSDRWDFDQGFQTFQNFIRENKANNAKAVVRSAKQFIKKRKGKPFYLYLGTSDPHVTYRRHKEFIETYDGVGYKGNYTKSLSGAELGKLKGRNSPPRARDQKRIEALYENEIAFNDHHFGELVKALKKEGIYDETMIIVSADHGDEFWEHGSCGHGHSLYQELVSVPLMIHWPGTFPNGRFTAGAEGVDLLPTMIELLSGKLSKGAALQGRSLLPQLKATESYPQAQMASQATERFTLAFNNAKVIFRGRGAIESYDLSRDHTEQKDLSTQDATLTSATLDPLMIYLSRPRTWSKERWGAPNALTGDFPRAFPKAWLKLKSRKTR